MITKRQAKRMVGKGWYSLLNAAYALKPKTIEISDVKEKWGGLRIYFNSLEGTTEKQFDDFCNLTLDLENKSVNLCEECGKAGQLLQNERKWWKCLCKECFKEWV